MGLQVIGVKYPLVLSLISVLMEFVPVLGAVIAGTLIVGVAFLQSPTQALIVLIFEILLQQSENHILVPNVMHSQTDISPLLAVLAIFAGGTLGGLIGAFIAIPLASALQVLVRDVVAPAVRRHIGATGKALIVVGSSRHRRRARVLVRRRKDENGDHPAS